MELYDYQKKAIMQLKNGNILCGGVGSGKSRTALGYFYYRVTKKYKDKLDLYIITTARKRDTHDWEDEALPFHLDMDHVFIDSWNNIQKYKDITNAFFIFDEDRVVGSGAWSKAFIKIAKHNKWILLSATPGDTWTDYIPVFIANGFYRNRTEFNARHVVFSRFVKFPKIERFIDVPVLEKYRDQILVDMDFDRPTTAQHITEFVDYDKTVYKTVWKNRVDPRTGEPIENISELCYILRWVVNSNETRAAHVKLICDQRPKVIIFYNFDYELEILKQIKYKSKTVIAEWNGHMHELIPNTDRWVYLVQYTAGAEGWNCIETNTIIFYSQNYSYKVMTQSEGRIARLNTPFKTLYYYHLESYAPIDVAIKRALKKKKKFNERSFVSKT